MSNYKKPIVEISEVEDVLREHFSTEVTGIMPLEGSGNISTVFCFRSREKEYIIKFGDLAGGFETEKFISTLLSSHEPCEIRSNKRLWQDKFER